MSKVWYWDVYLCGKDLSSACFKTANADQTYETEGIISLSPRTSATGDIQHIFKWGKDYESVL